MGAAEEAVDYINEGLDAARRAHAEPPYRVLSVLLATSYSLLDRIYEAFDQCRRALAICRQANDDFCEASALTELGHLEMSQARPDAAQEYWTDALAIFEKLNVPEADDVRVLLAP